jgi:hypothetical protein
MGTGLGNDNYFSRVTTTRIPYLTAPRAGHRYSDSAASAVESTMAASDAQVMELMKILKRGTPLAVAALKVGLDPKTARHYRDVQKLPSELVKTRAWRTRADPLDASDVQCALDMLADAPDLEAKTLFDFLAERHPSRYQEGQLRTFQRRIERWRRERGPEHEVFFAQAHRPGEAVQTDFTEASSLNVTIAGEAFPHLLCHCVLPHSNVEVATICRSESMLALKQGVQRALFCWGAVPEWHQTDHSTAATHRIGAELPADERGRTFNAEYLSFVDHFGMKPRTIGIGASEQNGDVESGNNALKRRLHQHLLLRGGREFATEEAWQAFVDQVVARANAGRTVRFAVERAAMRTLSVGRTPDFVEVTARVTKWSTITAKAQVYSVPSRLIGTVVRVRLFESRVEVWTGDSLQLAAPRAIGKSPPTINYRHMIWSLVRKPQAFARYVYRDAMYPTMTFRRAYDALVAASSASTKTDLEYLRLLHLAASTGQSDVEAAIALILDENRPARLDEVRQLVTPHAVPVLSMAPLTPDLRSYDALIGGAT